MLSVEILRVEGGVGEFTATLPKDGCTANSALVNVMAVKGIGGTLSVFAYPDERWSQL